MKDMNQFPCLAWIDLGNNVDVSSMPQPLLVGLRKRLNLQTALPTIYESLDSDSELSTSPKIGQLEVKEVATAVQAEKAPLKAEEESGIFPQRSCERWLGNKTFRTKMIPWLQSWLYRHKASSASSQFCLALLLPLTALINFTFFPVKDWRTSQPESSSHVLHNRGSGTYRDKEPIYKQFVGTQNNLQTPLTGIKSHLLPSLLLSSPRLIKCQGAMTSVRSAFKGWAAPREDLNKKSKYKLLPCAKHPPRCSSVFILQTKGNGIPYSALRADQENMWLGCSVRTFQAQALGVGVSVPSLWGFKGNKYRRCYYCMEREEQDCLYHLGCLILRNGCVWNTSQLCLACYPLGRAWF